MVRFGFNYGYYPRSQFYYGGHPVERMTGYSAAVERSLDIYFPRFRGGSGYSYRYRYYHPYYHPRGYGRNQSNRMRYGGFRFSSSYGGGGFRSGAAFYFGFGPPIYNDYAGYDNSDSDSDYYERERARDKRREEETETTEDDDVDKKPKAGEVDSDGDVDSDTESDDVGGATTPGDTPDADSDADDAADTGRSARRVRRRRRRRPAPDPAADAATAAHEDADVASDSADEEPPSMPPEIQKRYVEGIIASTLGTELSPYATLSYLEDDGIILVVFKTLDEDIRNGILAQLQPLAAQFPDVVKEIVIQDEY